MDIESLEAANQSLQVDLKLAFKRIGDLQAAIEDEMESDDNEDLINRYIPLLKLRKLLWTFLHARHFSMLFHVNVGSVPVG